MDLYFLLGALLCFSFPLLARYGDRKAWLPSWLSSIIACYGMGIIVSNLRLLPVNNPQMEQVAAAAMLVGLPLLLFAVRFRESLRYARSMLLCFALCCLSGLIFTSIAGYLMAGDMQDSWKVAGMLVGLYTGGTPNVQAIGIGLGAPTDYVVLVQAADVLLGGAYLLGLITFLPALFAKVFRKTPGEDEVVSESEKKVIPASLQIEQLGVALLVVAASAGLTWLITGKPADSTVIILALTTLALLATGIPQLKRLGNTYPLGEYFILVFSVALGLMADFRALAANGMDLLWFSFIALTGTTLLHLILSRLFNLDRDTVILASVAAFYGPVFVVQVASALKNQRLMAAAIAVSLIGFGIGNYLGISLAYFVRYLIS